MGEKKASPSFARKRGARKDNGPMKGTVLRKWTRAPSELTGSEQPIEGGASFAGGDTITSSPEFPQEAFELDLTRI